MKREGGGDEVKHRLVCQRGARFVRKAEGVCFFYRGDEGTFSAQESMGA